MIAGLKVVGVATVGIFAAVLGLNLGFQVSIATICVWGAVGAFIGLLYVICMPSRN